MSDECLGDDVRERLAAHVAAIVRRSAIPAGDRDDVLEELTGHLEQRYRAARDAGRASEAAASEAIAGFGAADEIGRAFLTTYHSRLWASTIGQLLPIADDPGAMPGAVRWTIRFERVMAALTLIGTIASLALFSPVRAVIGTLLGLAAAAAWWLAAEGLARRQRWAIPISLIGLAINVVILMATLVPPNGGWNLSVNGAIALILLVWLVGSGSQVDTWVAESRPIPAPLATLLAFGLVASAVAGVASEWLPDPTQIGPSDITGFASVECAVAPVEDGIVRIPAPIVAIEILYRRTDLAPRGVVRSGNDWGDTIGVTVDPWDGAFGPVVATTTDDNGATIPLDISMELTDSLAIETTDARSIFNGQLLAAEILGIDQRSGRAIRIVVPTFTNIVDDRAPDERGTPLERMSVLVTLTHLDRFVLHADIPCGGRQPLVDASHI